MNPALLVLSAEALDEVMAGMGLAFVEKALNPLDPDDFLTIVAELKKALIGLTGPAEALALAKALHILDVDWATLPADQGKKLQQAAKEALAKPPVPWPKVQAKFAVEGERIVNGVKTKVFEEYGLDLAVKLSEVDKRIIDKSAKAQGFYIKDQYGKRSDAHDKLASSIITKGIEKGAGREEIGQQLKAALSAQSVERSDSYWSLVAAAHVNRSRVYASLAGYDEAGFDEYEFVAIRDQVTSVQCRLLHGKRFSIKTALGRYAAVTDDPESVKTATPWMQSGKDDDGNEIVYFKDASGARQTVAVVKENAVGQKDKSGSFDTKMSNAAMAEAGIATPPCHGHCRSRLKAVTDIAIRTPGPKPAAPAQVAAPAPPKKPAAPPAQPKPPAAASSKPKAPKKPSGGSTTGPDEPVLVKPADPKEPGFKIPPKPAPKKPPAAAAPAAPSSALNPNKLPVPGEPTPADVAAALEKLKNMHAASGPHLVNANKGGLNAYKNPGDSPAVAKHGFGPLFTAAEAAKQTTIVPVKDLVAGSLYLPTAEVEKAVLAFSKSGPPVVYELNGKFVVFSDNPKALAAQLLKQETIEVKVLDLASLPKPQYKPPPPPPPPPPVAAPAKPAAPAASGKPPTLVVDGRPVAAPVKGLQIEALPKGEIPYTPTPPVKNERMSVVSKRSLVQRGLDARAAEKRVMAARDAASNNAIIDFTGDDYTGCRAAERLSDAEALKQGYSKEELAKWRKMSADIDRAFVGDGLVKGDVYRGIAGLSKKDILKMLESTEMTLGGTSSTSWSPDIADGFANGGGDPDEGAHSVFYRLKVKKGLPIEGISQVYGEKEILIKKGTRFKVTGFSKANDNYIIIDAEEI